MRLSQQQQTVIRQVTQEVFGEMARVWLFGSRVDDAKRGGDIDLLINPQTSDMTQAMRQKITLLVRLEQQLGERKIDILLEMPGDSRPIIAMAHATGVLL